MTQATITEIRRKFGKYSQRGLREPIKVTRRGVREFVLMSAERYDWLVAAVRRAHRTADAPQVVIDSVRRARVTWQSHDTFWTRFRPGCRERCVPERGGPAKLDSFSRPDKWSSAVQAAAASGSESKYTASGVRRSRAVCGRRVLKKVKYRVMPSRAAVTVS